MDTEMYAAVDESDSMPAAADLAGGRRRTQPVRERVRLELQRRLMDGEFGAQHRLREEPLAALLGVSRTPVREALIELASEGMLSRIDGSYYPVALDLTGLRDEYELRITIEVRAIARALENESVSHDPALLTPLLAKWRGLRADPPAFGDPRFVILDEDFHVTLCRASGNAALTAALESVNARIRLVRTYDFLTLDRIEVTIDEHLEICELVLAGQLAKAITAMQRHIGESLDIVEQRVAAAATQMLRHPPNR